MRGKHFVDVNESVINKILGIDDGDEDKLEQIISSKSKQKPKKEEKDSKKSEKKSSKPSKDDDSDLIDIIILYNKDGTIKNG